MQRQRRPLMRERRAPLTEVQMSCLISLINENASSIQAKRQDPRTFLNKKNAWRRVTDAFNSMSQDQPPRTLNQLKRTWEHVKRTIKQKEVQYKRRLRLTGGGRPPSPPYMTDAMREAALILKAHPCRRDNQYDSPGMDPVTMREVPDTEVTMEFIDTQDSRPQSSHSPHPLSSSDLSLSTIVSTPSFFDSPTFTPKVILSELAPVPSPPQSTNSFTAIPSSSKSTNPFLRSTNPFVQRNPSPSTISPRVLTPSPIQATATDAPISPCPSVDHCDLNASSLPDLDDSSLHPIPSTSFSQIIHSHSHVSSAPAPGSNLRRQEGISGTLSLGRDQKLNCKKRRVQDEAFDRARERQDEMHERKLKIMKEEQEIKKEEHEAKKEKHEAKMCLMKKIDECAEKFKDFLDTGMYAFEMLSKACERDAEIISEAFEADANKKL